MSKIGVFRVKNISVFKEEPFSLGRGRIGFFMMQTPRRCGGPSWEAGEALREETRLGNSLP